MKSNKEKAIFRSPDYIFSTHLNKRIEQRSIKMEWIIDTIEKPDITEKIADDEVHFFKKIIAFNKQFLKVVYNPITGIIVTAHFDRKITKKYIQ